jgi:RsiW-degrading membrane proteinase PrsW (M82 family)
MTQVQNPRYPVLYQPRNPAWWLYIILLVAGFSTLSRQIVNPLDVYPVAFSFSLIFWASYTALWMAFLLKVQLFDPRPFSVMTLLFLWGGIIGTFALALEINNAVLSLLAKLVSPGFSHRWAASITAPVFEELAKSLGVVMLLLLARDRIRSVFDGVIIGATVGLGFQVFEDLIYTLNATNLVALGTEWLPTLHMVFLRGFVIGLSSHAMYSAIIGAGIAFFVLNRDSSRLKGFFGLLLACLCSWFIHALWDSPYVSGGETSLQRISMIVLPIAALFGILFILRHSNNTVAKSLDAEYQSGRLQISDKTLPRKKRRMLKKAHRHLGATIVRCKGLEDDYSADIDNARQDISRLSNR